MRQNPLFLLFVLALGACGPATSEGTSDGTGGSETPVASDEGNRGGVCTFNQDCPADQRCGCTETDGCACEDGARGTGRSGLDTCETGNDCASSLCIESNETNAAGAVFYCSDTCETHDDCAGALPACMDIVYIGRVCVRDGAA